jgi:hypothetical protein
MDDPPSHSCTAQGTVFRDQAGTVYKESLKDRHTDIQEEMSGEAGMQQCQKEPTPKTAATSKKQEGIQQYYQTDFRTGDHEASSRDFHRVMENMC